LKIRQKDQGTRPSVLNGYNEGNNYNPIMYWKWQ